MFGFFKKNSNPKNYDEKKQLDIQEIFKQNLEYISQTEVNPNTIESQFVKSETRYFFKIGMADFPSGKVIVADPLCYLVSGKMCPQLEINIPLGSYPMEVSICRNPDVGLRMCTVRLKIQETKAEKYICAQPTEDTAIAKCSDGVLSGFPVEAGMVTICDALVASEYRAFLDNWHRENQGKNHYDDYFADFFSESAETLPEYQREGGDFIEWTNPDTKHKMVMVASGFGDGLYQCFFGYDSENEICELIIPMVNPDFFDF